ncbi:MAG: Unknown protein [uncultured Sulfurovum sp.]|uniref:Outer membrane protein beta-barrel domain-containing protein n=1 Tax=uncultured Sulfurovum sp. TaxID=269237 RepID=A0A6S6TXD7_9BACT|nr:MAG: Unknown protein [uncultured Sulfurovum sp.]
MKKITTSLVFVSTLSFAGGTIGQLNMDEVIIQDDLNQANQQINVTPPPPPPAVKVIEEVKKEPLPVVVPAPKFYIGGSIANSRINTENATEILKNTSPIIGIAKIGYNIMDNLALEARAGTGIKADEITATSESNVERIVGAYLKPTTAISDNMNLFALAGYAKTQLEQKVLSSEVSGLSYGLGINYNFNPNWSMVADVVRYGKNDKSRVDTASLGLEYAF